MGTARQTYAFRQPLPSESWFNDLCVYVVGIDATTVGADEFARTVDNFVFQHKRVVAPPVADDFCVVVASGHDKHSMLVKIHLT